MNTPKRRIGGLIALALLGGALVPAAALGATATTKSSSTAPQAGGDVALQTWPENGQLVVVTEVNIPPSVKLPTVVRVPLVTGSTIQWAGEVLGGDVSADPARKYTVKQSPFGGSYAEFTAEATRSAQVDSVVSGLTTKGNSVTGSLEWIQSAASPSTSFSVRTPANAAGVKITPSPSGQPDISSTGESLWSIDPVVMTPGQKQTITIAYTVGQPTGTSAAGSSNTLIIVLVIALIVAVVAAIAIFVRQQQAAEEEPPPPAPRSSRESSGGSRKAPEKPAPAEREPEPDDEDWGFDDSD